MKNYLKNIFFALLFLLNIGTLQAQQIVLSTPKGGDVKKNGWGKEYWSKKENYSDAPSSRFNTQTLHIKADTLGVNRWYKKINIKPYATYLITGYIKTENVVGENANAGAGFRLGNFAFSNDRIFKGSTAWTYVEMKFYSGGDDSVLLECLLGKNGTAKGSVYFDNFFIKELSAKVLKPSVVLNMTQKKEPMSPYLYGQFIEHMGKCIYGGIWAEMLEDRKFYYTPNAKKSPWKVNIDTATITQDKSHSFAKRVLPVLSFSGKNLVLSQENLAVFANKNYEGRLVFSADKTVKKVTVALVTETERSEKSFDIPAEPFQKIPFTLTSKANTNNATLEITFTGEGKVTFAAASLMPDDNVQGYRKDVLQLMKELNSPIYRWPGGNFVSGYDWKDGIGDADKRPTKYERAWNGLEYNDVGIHEFMNLCKLLNTEAYIAVNTGLGTAEMAAEEVEYFNGGINTKMGKWRAENGHTEPYKIKLWAVGNEMFGDWQLGYMPIEKYVVKHNEVAKAMWKVDPSIELVAVGAVGKWNDMMYTHTSDNMTFISEHFYRQDWHAGGLLTHVKQIADAIREVADEHRRCRKEITQLKGKNVKIALDEWNYWYGPHDYGLLGTKFYLRDALGIAAGLNEFTRQSDIYYMANYAQTVNVIGAIKTTKTDAWLEGTGLVLKLYRNEFGTIPVTIEGAPQPLDVAATLTEDGKYLTVSVINATHQAYPLKLAFKQGKVAAEGTRFTVSRDNDMIYNNKDAKNNISIYEEKVSLTNNTLIVPKESAAVYKFAL